MLLLRKKNIFIDFVQVVIVHIFTPGQRASQKCIAMFSKMAAEFGIFERRLGMSKVWYKYRVLTPSGKAVLLHSQRNMVACSFSFQKIPNMSWFRYRRTDSLRVTSLV